MGKERDKLLDHDYDGITEYDNPLPPWWLYLFYISIAWAVVYMVFYHFGNWGSGSDKEYAEEMKLYAGVTKKTPDQDFSKFTALSDEASLTEGKDVFTKNCVSCHAADGGGGIGPNLCDDYWIHGGSFGNIVKTITIGVPQKGMLTWKGILNESQILKVASYIETFKGTTPAVPKAPQGILEKLRVNN